MYLAQVWYLCAMVWSVSLCACFLQSKEFQYRNDDQKAWYCTRLLLGKMNKMVLIPIL